MSKLDEIRKSMGGRYIGECLQLSMLANYALNKPKNASKPDFESMDIDEVFKLLKQEMTELKIELYKTHNGVSGSWEVPRDKKDIDWDSALEELADVAACATGILVKILKEIEE